MMNNTNSFRTLLPVLLAIMLSSCALVEGIFKAGMGAGIFIVVAIIAAVIFIIVRIGRGKK